MGVLEKESIGSCGWRERREIRVFGENPDLGG